MTANELFLYVSLSTPRVGSANVYLSVHFAFIRCHTTTHPETVIWQLTGKGGFLIVRLIVTPSLSRIRRKIISYCYALI